MLIHGENRVVSSASFDEEDRFLRWQRVSTESYNYVLLHELYEVGRTQSEE